MKEQQRHNWEQLDLHANGQKPPRRESAAQSYDLQGSVTRLLGLLLMRVHERRRGKDEGSVQMSKISADHSSRAAYVYVRQSTSDQLTNNPVRAVVVNMLLRIVRGQLLGWSNVIRHRAMETSGVQAAEIARPGFERLLAAICTCGRPGAVLRIEVSSRLARNGRDWHTLLEFCALVRFA